MSVSDQQLVDSVVEAVRQGHTMSRADILAHCGLTGPRAIRVIGLAVQTRRLRMCGRDRLNSPTYTLVADQPAESVAEVLA